MIQKIFAILGVGLLIYTILNYKDIKALWSLIGFILCFLISIFYKGE